MTKKNRFKRKRGSSNPMNENEMPVEETVSQPAGAAETDVPQTPEAAETPVDAEALQQELGLTYLLITHDIELLGWISHRIGVMYQGQLVEAGPRDQIMEHPSNAYTQGLLSAFRDWDKEYT